MKPVLRFPLVFLAGALAVGGFHPFEVWYMPFLSLLAAVFLVKDLAVGVRCFGFYLYGLGFLLPLLHWSSTYVGSFPWLILSFTFASFYSILAFGFTENRIHIAKFTFLFLIAESMRAVTPFGGFGWGRFGFSQLDGPLAPWLRIGGVSLVGGVLAFSVAVIARSRRHWFLLVPVFLFSFFPSLQANAAPSGDPLEIGLIQGGVSQLGLEFNATPREVLNRHLEESERLLREEKVDLLLWPENASDIDPLRNRTIRDRIASLATQYQTPMVLGAVIQGDSGPENVSILFDARGEVESIYQKRDLVPFGEYVPLRSIAERFSSLVDEVKDFVPGKEIVSHSIAGMNFAPLICYEILDDRVAWENLSRSSFGVVQTNNATFGRSWQSGQQFQMTRVRAYEARTPIVVAATTGDTALIDPDGNAVDRLPKFQRSHLVVEVSPVTPQIPPVDPMALAFFAAVAFISLSLWDRKHPKGPDDSANEE